MIDDDVVRAAAERLGGGTVRDVQPIPRSGNNRLYRVRFDDGERALKWYPRVAGDERDRLGVEFGALQFLAGAAITVVPRAIAADAHLGCALYEWIDGRTPAGDARTVDAMLAFAAGLHAASATEGARELGWAAEAVRSPADLAEQVERRLVRLGSVTAAEPLLAAFLHERFVPVWEGARAQSAGVAPVSRFTLSPSDFGTHNMLERADGRMTFLDFEYFGWDDPVKLACDVLWHPGMGLDPAAARQFRSGAADIYSDDPTYAARQRAWFPLFGLRWALIVLNEFLPANWERRRLAGAPDDWELAKARQLAKAEDFVLRAAAAAGECP